MHYSPNDSNGGQGQSTDVKNWRHLTGFSELFDYWNSIRVEGDVPRADKFDLLALTQWLPNLMLLDILGDDNVVARFAGTALVDRMGYDLTRQNVVLDQASESRNRVMSAYKTVISHPCGLSARYTNHYSSGRSGIIHTLYLPLKAPTNGNARVVGLNHREADAGYAAPIERTESATDILGAEWVDLGSGVPAEKP